ncbi:transcription termination factor 1, mitochondrial [Salminus brasiliensis]|uniref:transcription termination factor 1, mitochondrial n=1 Tax=Salminus brasiliensis TaxID=930266 RepID=UPI003B831C93
MALQQQLLRLLKLHQSRLLQPSAACARGHVSRPSSSTSNDNLDCSPLLENLSILGVDLKSAWQRQPGVLRKAQTNEHGLAEFLSHKGASRDVIASIISRYPRAITRSGKHLEERWKLWHSILQDDSEIIRILDRSPESFFRSSDNEDLEKNIVFLTSLGVMPRDLMKLLSTAPRVFSNSLELNRAMVELLKSVCESLGGRDHEAFARAILFKNAYVLIRSTKRVSANIQFLLTYFMLSNAEALNLLQSHGAKILDLSHTSLERNIKNLQAKLKTLGCSSSETKKLVLKHSVVLFVSAERLNKKLDCLVEGGIDVKHIVGRPNVLDFSIVTLKQRLSKLNTIGYDFEANGIGILDMSKKRFQQKLMKLQVNEK